MENNKKDNKGINIESLRMIVEAAQKPYISNEEAKALYSIGRHTLERLAKDSGARRKIGSKILYNTKVLNEFIEEMFSDVD